jgi:hypothetical protein
MTSADVTGSLGFTPYNATNPAGYQTAAQVTAVLPAASSTTPLMDGAAAIGTGTTWARADHVHASDTSRAPLANAPAPGVNGSVLASNGTVAAYTRDLGNLNSVIVNQNTAPLPPPPRAPALRIGGLDNSNTGISMNAFGGFGSVITFSQSRGTAAAPTAILNNDVIGLIEGYGHGATAYGANPGWQIVTNALENWTDAAQGTQIYFATNAIGSTSSSARLVIRQGVTIGNPASGDLGAGTINAAWTIATNGSFQAGSSAGSGVAYPWHAVNIVSFGWVSPALHGWVDATDLGPIQFTASSARYKANITPATKDALACLRDVELFAFDRATPFERHEDVGFIAEQLQPLIPEAVTLDKDGAAGGLDLMPLLAYSVGAIQQLAARLEALESRIAELEGARH